MEHLIADSGIHFVTYEAEFIPSEPLRVDKKALKYYFAETTDIVEGYKIFNILYYNEEIDKLIPVNELMESNYDVVLRRPSGREEVDPMGMIKMVSGAETSLFTTYDEDDADVYSINSLLSFYVPNPNDAHNKLPAFEMLLDKWLPIPMFKAEKDGVTRHTPLAWCRMRMTRIDTEKGSGKERFRLVYAFDTQTATDEWDILRPYVSEDDEGMSVYKMCNRADLLLMNFMSSDENGFHAFSDYISSILNIDTTRDDSLKYKAFYVYFLNFIRLLGCSPEVTLHDNKSRSINVDLVLDIGNSRTCGILFQESDFTKGKMLELRDLTHPHIYYENETYDMRVVFRKADFGNDIVLGEDMFQWRSFVRIGEEARRLVYSSIAGDGIAEKTTYYSSPKRYLWDMKKYDGQWENLITNDDLSSNVALSPSVAVQGLSDLFTPDGTYDPNYSDERDELIDFGRTERHYSRSSLMTFAFIEIFQHALAQINSIRYRGYWGDVNIRRVLRNVIITCPPAMPLNEQIFLRKSASDAYEALTKCVPTIPMANITPSPEALRISDPNSSIEKMTWKYDEATCCQLVYLYAEIAQRYGGESKKFFDMKGHKSVTDDEMPRADKELTIGTIDIGAGTTDIMICSYAYNANNHKTITPVPLFYDSFYLAGDDILRNIVQNIVIEGKDIGQENIGNITSALTAHICSMTDEELQSLPCLDVIVYRNKVNDIMTTVDKDEIHRKKVAFASSLIHDFFGTDSSMMSYKDRQCRNDFNTQISVAIAQKMLELVRTKRPSKLYTYEELFPAVKPAKYLLDYFEHHFGFRFESLSWRYNPEDISAIVKSTMEPLLKQLSVVLYSQKCDIIVLGGRPTSLDAITELFIKYLPVSPDRLVRLNDYQVGSWFPAADGNGYFYDQKAIVAVGAMIGYLAARGELKNLTIDFTKMIMKMTSTANYMGEYNKQLRQVQKSLLSPTGSSAEISASSFPIFIGCRQLDSPSYQARPLYAIYNNGSARELNIRISRDFSENKEELYIEEVTDNEYRNRKGDVELVQQSLVEDGKYWLDKGEFELTIKK